MSVIKGEGTAPILFGMRSVTAGAITHETYLARPDVSGELPTLVIVPSEWGMTSSVKDLARRIARHGVAAIAVDVFAGNQPARRDDREAAAAAFEAVAPARAKRHVSDVVRYVGNPAGFWSSAEHGLAILGIGAGGVYAAAVAAEFDSALILAAAPLPIDGLADITRPILGLVGRQDELVPIEAVMEARGRLPHSEWVIYDGAGHDFLDDYIDGFDFETLRDAVERIARFCEKHLTPGG